MGASTELLTPSRHLEPPLAVHEVARRAAPAASRARRHASPYAPLHAGEAAGSSSGSTAGERRKRGRSSDPYHPKQQQAVPGSDANAPHTRTVTIPQRMPHVDWREREVAPDVVECNTVSVRGL